ncbi:MAG: MotA/TolQ/ExbB proton channel family protein [Spirochaetes bacterium]|nr:MotA/TolQ/ExbB proton channel family protein [Spirochaetota bacterium]
MKTEILYIIAVVLLTFFSFIAWLTSKLLHNLLLKKRIKKEQNENEHFFLTSGSITFINLAFCFLLSIGFIFSFRFINFIIAENRLERVEVVTHVLEKLGYDAARLSSLQYGVKYRINNESRLEDYQSKANENLDDIYDAEIVTRFFNEFFQAANRKFHSKYILNLFDKVLMQNNMPIPAVRGISTLVYRLSGLEMNDNLNHDFSNYLKKSFSPNPGIFYLKYPSPKNILYGMGSDFEMITRELNKSVINDEDGYLGIQFITSYLDNTAIVMYPYFKVANQISGLIQLLIYMLFFWGISIMSVRWLILSNEKKIKSFWEEFIKGGNINADISRRGANIIPEYKEISLENIEEEKALLNQFSHFIYETKGVLNKQIFFSLQIMKKLWDSLSESMKKRGCDVHAKSVEDVFKQADKSLENIEYANVNYITWAIPSLGFIGTVLGISEALGNADEVVKAPDVAAQAFAITDITTMLGVAFDTTLVALICSVPLFFMIQTIRSSESKFFISFEQKISTLIKERLKYLEN